MFDQTERTWITGSMISIPKKSRLRSIRFRGAFLGLILLLALHGTAFPQDSNQITAVNPDTAAQGTTDLLVTFTLDTDAPPAPPAGIPPTSVTIGTLSGSSVTHPSQYTVIAVFTIPADEPIGVKDVTVTFPIPQGGSLIFSKPSGFTVTPGGNMPPDVTLHPQSRTVPPGGSVIFSIIAAGTFPMEYQWQKNQLDIEAAIDSTYTIDPVNESDEGNYRCVVTNDYGSDTSDEAVLTVEYGPVSNYPIVDTGQDICYNASTEIGSPGPGEPFNGQDAQYEGNQPDYTISGDGLTVLDNVTGLTWQRNPDTNDDGILDSDDKMSWTEIQSYPAILNSRNFGGYDDWRLPGIEELYSLIDFSGIDPSGYTGGTSGLVPFIDTDYFDFVYGDENIGERIIDAQYWSSTEYVGTTMNGENTVFGVNFADGRIKGYPRDTGPGGTPFTEFIRCVRGGEDYGINSFIDNDDDTVTDQATGLMWMREDSGEGLTWEEALAYAENLEFAGYDDWRLPNAKELQSIVDYTRAPSITGTAALDPAFAATSIINEAGQLDYPFYWSGTTHVNWSDTPGAFGAYVAFGNAMGYMNGAWMDVHGAGAQRSDPKEGDPDDWPYGHGPQGDAIRIYNFVRCVRDWEPDVELSGDISDQTLELTWNTFPGASANWVYGAENDAFFTPGLTFGYAYRLAALPGTATTWSTTNGIGDPENNWTYLVIAVDDSEQELSRSKRIGELDFSGDVGFTG